MYYYSNDTRIFKIVNRYTFVSLVNLKNINVYTDSNNGHLDVIRLTKLQQILVNRIVVIFFVI